MNKIKNWFKKIGNFVMESNHYKHAIGGFIVGLLGLGMYGALYASIVAASCLEFKDKAHGGKWDWIDWGFTVFGGIIAVCIYAFIL